MPWTVTWKLDGGGWVAPNLSNDSLLLSGLSTGRHTLILQASAGGRSSYDTTFFTTYANSVTDSRDSKVYPIVTIGTQTWMAANLDFGTQVAGSSNQGDASVTGAQKYCYGDLASGCTRSGGLYQWHSAMALPASCDNATLGSGACIASAPHRGLCPVGWHLPDHAEWVTLSNWVDADNGGGSNDDARSLRAPLYWGVGVPARDEYGWRGLPGGYRAGGTFYSRDDNGWWWSSTEGGTTSAVYAMIALNEFQFGYEGKASYGANVRCVMD